MPKSSNRRISLAAEKSTCAAAAERCLWGEKGGTLEKGQTTLKKEKRVGTGFFLSLFHFFLSWVDHVVSSGTQFLSFFLLVAVFLSLGFRRPNILTGLSGWRTPD